MSGLVSGGYVVYLAPLEMATRFRCRQPLPDELLDTARAGEPDDEPVLDVGAMSREELLGLIEELPPREADIMWMRLVLGKTQADIGEIFGVTQSGVSYRVDRALEKLAILRDLPRFTEAEMRRDLKHLFGELDMAILWAMYVTTRGSAAAKIVDRAQPRVTAHVREAVTKLREEVVGTPHFRPYLEAFTTIRDKPGLARDFPIGKG